MDPRAELTLRVARLVQEAGTVRRATTWFLIPSFRPASWDEAHDLLSHSPKPLIVGPLVEPGYLAIWRLDEMAPEQRRGAESILANQVAFNSEKLTRLGLKETDTLRLETADERLDLSVADFLRWSTEYAISAGIAVENTAESGVGRLLIRTPGGGRRPLGAVHGA